MIQFDENNRAFSDCSKSELIAHAEKFGVDDRVLWPDLEECQAQAMEILTAHADDERGQMRTLEELNDIVWAMQQSAAVNTGKLFADRFDELVSNGNLTIKELK